MIATEKWRRQWHPTPVLLPGKSHGWRSLVGCRPWGLEESDTTEQLHFPFSLSCIGEGNGNPLQCSCLENPRDGGAWWAAICGVAQSQTQLKRLSSSSSHWKDTYAHRSQEERTWHVEGWGPLRETPGPARRQRDGGTRVRAFTVVSVGRNGRGGELGKQA